MVEYFSQGMDMPAKARIIAAVAGVPVERLTALADAFTPNLQQLNTFVPGNERASLINGLVGMQPDQWQTEILRTINLYRHQGGGNAPYGVAFEVHNYAGEEVETGNLSYTNSRSLSPKTMRLDSAVMETMALRLQSANLSIMPYTEAEKLLNEWIEKKISRSRG